MVAKMPIINSNGQIIQSNVQFNLIANNIDADEIISQFSNTAAIAIEFPSHSDGRGFSLAKLLRLKGFNGALRAIGPVIPDQFPDLLSCGFNEIEISDEQLTRQPIEQWQNALKTYSLSYQRVNGSKKSILEARHAK